MTIKYLSIEEFESIVNQEGVVMRSSYDPEGYTQAYYLYGELVAQMDCTDNVTVRFIEVDDGSK